MSTPKAGMWLSLTMMVGFQKGEGLGVRAEVTKPEVWLVNWVKGAVPRSSAVPSGFWTVT
jgi:hypothetical protein